MHGSQLLLLIRQLDRRELKRISKYVRSPFFNLREDVIRLFDYLEKHVESPPQYLTKEKVFPEVYPNEKFDGQKLLYAMSFLLQHIRDYLALDSFKTDDFDAPTHLLRALRRRGIDKFFERSLGETTTDFDKQPLRNADYHFAQYELWTEQYELKHWQSRTGSFPFQEMSDELTAYFVAQTLRHACASLAHQTMSQRIYEQLFLDLIIEKIKQGYWANSLAVNAYWLAYQTLLNQSDTEGGHFSDLKELLVNRWQAFPQHELRDLYLIAINYCIKRLNRSDKRFERETFDLYRSGLENRILFENNILSPYTYKNALAAGIMVGELAWTENSIETFKNFLPERDREMVYRYNLAIFYFRQNRYADAMTILAQLNLREPLHQLDARRMLIRIYYDSSEWAALSPLLDSTKIYLRRQTDLGYGGESYLNFINFLQKILKIDPKDSAGRAILRGGIEAEKYVAEREWLMSKL
jgi:hypothetical protein